MQVTITKTLNNDTLLLERFIQSFSFKRWASGFLESIEQKLKANVMNLLNDIYVGLKGAKQIVVEQYTKEQAKEALSEIRPFKIRLVNFSNKIEKINYFEDGEVKELVKHCSRAMNELEIALRKKAFKGDRKSSTSPELLQAISNKSKEALTKSLFAQ
jgi:hypothetical protein